MRTYIYRMNEVTDMQKKNNSIFWILGAAVVAAAVIVFLPKLIKVISEKLAEKDIDDMEFEDEDFLFEEEFDDADVAAAEAAVKKEMSELQAESEAEKAEDIFEEE